jgi:NDP-sugar pyrophosphorylase family protein
MKIMSSFIENLKVIIPVGGEAKRLKPLTTEVSKAIVRLCLRPIVEIAMITLAKQGVRTFIFGVKGYVNYKSLHDYFKEGIGISARYGINPRMHIKYMPRIEDVGNADSVRIIMNYYDIEDSIVGVQGDNIFDIDLADFVRFHEKKKALMTIGLTSVENVEDYGIAALDKDFGIKRFVEKPKRKDAPSNLANSGIYMMSPKIREIFKLDEVKRMVEEKKRLDFGMDLIPFLIDSGYPVYGYVLKGEWYDVGTPKRYLDAMTQILRTGGKSLNFQGRLSIDGQVWIQGESPESVLRRNEIIKKMKEGKITFEGAVLIGRHCSIGDGVKIKDSCIDNFAIIGEGAIIEKSTVMDRSIVGRNAEIRDSIVGRHVVINSSLEHPTLVSGVSVIGDDVSIGEGCEIIATKIYPHKTIPAMRRMVNEVLE